MEQERGSLESMVDKDFWRDKKVLITGNTGFKGSWCHLVLSELDANILGFSRDIITNPSNYAEIEKEKNFKTVFADILDREALFETILDFKPEIIIHMAAQAIVKTSYTDPLDTFNSNIIGTLNVMEAARNSNIVKVLINVTSDKCYENNETNKAFVESDKLGGKDIYSASKACAEILTNAYKESFLCKSDTKLKIASVRAGNVIGGGDWSEDRLIPDIIRSIKSSNLSIRNPNAIRPWQHVLDPVHGYLLLAKKIYLSNNESFQSPWNFGPHKDNAKTVGWILEETSKFISNFRYNLSSDIKFKESHFLRLDSSKAIDLLGWKPVWDAENAFRKTIEWYLNRQKKLDSSASLMIKDLKDYWSSQ